MSAVASNIEEEVAALHRFKERPLPITCNEIEYDEELRKIARTIDGQVRSIKLHNKNNKGVQRMTPCDLVQKYYEFPFDLYPFQVRTINELAELPRAGYYLDMGLGKTVVSMSSALFKSLTQGAEKILVVVPPVLLTGWSRFIASIRDRETGPLSSLVYRGTPKERKALSLDADIILVGIQIFKRDYQRFSKELGDKRVVVIVDEAHCLKNISSDNHKKVREFSADADLMLLTGTPINSPIDAYGMVKMVAPRVYRNLHQFENIHIAERDFFGNVTRWKNMDLLQNNLTVNSVRLLKEECIADLPPVSYQPMYYELEPEHLALYRKLAEEHLLPFADGQKLDATSVQALLHALGQIVCNWSHFAQDDSKVSAGFQLVDEVLDELGDGKAVLFSNYKLTNRRALQHLKQYNPVAIYGDIDAADRDRALDKFVEDPSCRVFIGNPVSAGFGIDRLQIVSSTVMFLEPPISVSAFTQSLSRVHRIGQTKPVTVKLATAVGTLQERQLKALMDKEDLVQTLTRGYQSLREALGLKERKRK